MQNLDQKRQRIETIAKVAGTGIIGFLVAPFVFIAIKGLIGLIIAAIISFIAIQFVPVIGIKIANWKLKMIKQEAQKNPVESLQNIYKEKQEALSLFGESLKVSSAKIKTFESKLEFLSKNFPQEIPKFQEQKGKMLELQKLRERKYKEAKKGLEIFELEIQKADAIWQVSQAAADATKAAGMNEGEFFAKIQKETALDSVQESLNMSFAELETALLEEDDAKSLPSTEQKNVIEIESPKFVKAN